MKKLLLLLLLLVGCASNEQIAACVQNCKGMNMTMSTSSGTITSEIFKCICVRTFNINDKADSIKETESN